MRIILDRLLYLCISDLGLTPEKTPVEVGLRIPELERFKGLLTLSQMFSAAGVELVPDADGALLAS